MSDSIIWRNSDGRVALRRFTETFRIQGKLWLHLALLLSAVAFNAGAQDPTPPEGAPLPYSPTLNAQAEAEVALAEKDVGPGKSGDTEDPLGYLNIAIDYRYPYRRDYDSLAQAVISLEALRSSYFSGGLHASVGGLELTPGSPTDTLAHTPLFGEFGFFGRLFFTPHHTFLQPYATASMGFALMIWDYRTSITSGDERIKRDCLHGVDGYVGLGLSVRLHQQMKLFGEIGIGGIAFYKKDFDGEAAADNDTIFRDFGYAGIKAGISVAF